MGCLSLCHAEHSLPTQKKLEKANFLSDSPLSGNEIKGSRNDFAISGNEVGTRSHFSYQVYKHTI